MVKPPLPMNCRNMTGRRRLQVGIFGIVFGQVEISDRDGTRWVRATSGEWRWCELAEDCAHAADEYKRKRAIVWPS